MPIVLLLLLVLVPLVVIALTPFLLIQRYRAGKARRLARPWLATLNLAVMAFSALFFLISSAFTTIWIPQSFAGAAAGIIAGLVLGGFGLLATRWEPTPRSLHYTPNSVLVLIVTAIVSVRVAYGLFRSLTLAGPGASGTELIAAFGVPQSLAAGGAVIGYYVAYNFGLRWRIRQWERRALRPM